jgi:hypothetical protein
MVLLYSDKNSFKIFISYCHLQNLSYSGGHFGFPIHTKIENFERDHPMIIQVQFGFNQIYTFVDSEKNYIFIFPLGPILKLCSDRHFGLPINRINTHL